MKRFDYLKPGTLDEALSLLNRYGKQAALIAGGTDVMGMIKKGEIAPAVLISLQAIPGLNEIQDDGGLRMGAMVTHRAIQKSSLVRERFTALSDAVDVLGSVQIRNVGTLGGNICTAAPSADTAPPLLVLGAQVKVSSREGERIVPINEFFKGPGKTILKEGEIVTEMILPEPLRHMGSAYWKHQRRLALDLPILGVSVLLSLNKGTISCSDPFDVSDPISSTLHALKQDELICNEVRIALGVAGPTPMRAVEAEELLKGRTISDELLDKVSQAASAEAQPRDSIRGEAWYRREMIKVFVKRMVLKCVERIVRPRPAF